MDKMEGGFTMKACPYCKNNMMKGRLQSGKGMRFALLREPKEGVPEGAVGLKGYNIGSDIMGTQLDAYMCENCKFIMFDYGPKKNKWK